MRTFILLTLIALIFVQIIKFIPLESEFFKPKKIQAEIKSLEEVADTTIMREMIVEICQSFTQWEGSTIPFLHVNYHDRRSPIKDKTYLLQITVEVITGFNSANLLITFNENNKVIELKFPQYEVLAFNTYITDPSTLPNIVSKITPEEEQKKINALKNIFYAEKERLKMLNVAQQKTTEIQKLITETASTYKWKVKFQ